MSTYRGKYPNRINEVWCSRDSLGKNFAVCLTNAREKYFFYAPSIGNNLPNAGDDIQKYIDMADEYNSKFLLSIIDKHLNQQSVV